MSHKKIILGEFQYNGKLSYYLFLLKKRLVPLSQSQMPNIIYYIINIPLAYKEKPEGLFFENY